MRDLPHPDLQIRGGRVNYLPLVQGRAAGAVRGLSVSDLPRLRTLVIYLRGELRRTEAALAAAEEREAATARQQPAP